MSFRTLLARVGSSLYGEYWIKPLAEDLGVNQRTVQRWAAGDFEPAAESRPGLLADLRTLVVARRADLADVIAEIDRSE